MASLRALAAGITTTGVCSFGPPAAACASWHDRVVSSERRVVAAELLTRRLKLTPLELADAPEMVVVLSDPGLYAHTGGSPPSLEELRSRYRRQLAGPWPPGQTWLNWVVRRSPEEPVGYVQATVTGQAADLAWVIGTDHQRQGYATEATREVAAWLVGRGVGRLTAHVAPGHMGSERVAAAVGMLPSGDVDDAGERIWHLDTNRPR
jgi:RimJ/RimL family protein N-acetyltransferase